MSILDEIDKGIAPPPAGGSPFARPISKADLLAKIRATYPNQPAVVQAKQPEAAGTAQQPAAAPTFPKHKEAPPRPFVVAVWEPANLRGDGDPGGWFFDESVSQAERQECIAEAENFELADARLKNPPPSRQKFHRGVL